MRMRTAAMLLIFPCLVGGHDLWAQAGRMQILILPRAGVLHATNPLGTLVDGQHELRAELRGGVLLGLAVQANAASRGLGVRVAVDYLRGPEVLLRVPHCPASFLTCGWTLNANLLLATAALVVRPFPAGSRLQPYVLVGGGMKQYEIERIPCMPAVRDDIPSCFVANDFAGEHRDLALLAGLGLHVRVGHAVLTAEVASATSWFRPGRTPAAEELFGKYPSRIQHDLSATLGLRLPVL